MTGPLARHSKDHDNGGTTKPSAKTLNPNVNLNLLHQTQKPHLHKLASIKENPRPTITS